MQKLRKAVRIPAISSESGACCSRHGGAQGHLSLCTCFEIKLAPARQHAVAALVQATMHGTGVPLRVEARGT